MDQMIVILIKIIILSRSTSDAPRVRPGDAAGENELVNRAVARRPGPAVIERETDPDVVSQYLEDAAHYPGGRATAVIRPKTIDAVAAAVGQSAAVLPVGARSSLTGGATPSGDVVISTERLTALRIHGDRVTVGAGVALATLQDALRPHGLWLPPVPTFLGATVGGAISTNAAGAATFKYGPMRPWVQALTLVLANGEVLSLSRGEVTASPDRRFVIDTAEGPRQVECPGAADARRPQTIRGLPLRRRAWISSICSSARKGRSASWSRPSSGCSRGRPASAG